MTLAAKIATVEDLIHEDRDTTIAEYWALLKDVEEIEIATEMREAARKRA